MGLAVGSIFCGSPPWTISATARPYGVTPVIECGPALFRRSTCDSTERSDLQLASSRQDKTALKTITSALVTEYRHQNPPTHD